MSYVDDETVIRTAPSTDMLASYTSAALKVIPVILSKYNLELKFGPWEVRCPHLLQRPRLQGSETQPPRHREQANLLRAR